MARKRRAKYHYWIREEGLTLLEGWARDGLTDQEIAIKCDISRSTLNIWKKKYSAIGKALDSGKEYADYEVENSLYKKSIGYYAKVQKAFKCKEVYFDDEGRRCEREEIQTVEVDEFFPPDTMAMAIWLNNRRPDKWKRNAGKEKLDEKKFEHEKEMDAKRYW